MEMMVRGKLVPVHVSDILFHVLMFFLAAIMHAHTGRLRAFIRTGLAAVRLAVADKTLARSDQAEASGTGTFHRLRHRAPLNRLYLPWTPTGGQSGKCRARSARCPSFFGIGGADILVCRGHSCPHLRRILLYPPHLPISLATPNVPDAPRRGFFPPAARLEYPNTDSHHPGRPGRMGPFGGARARGWL
jgi:hypothetical protein